MVLDRLVEKVQTIGGTNQIWLTAESFNELANERFRLNRKNNVVLASDRFEFELSINQELESKCATSCAKIERISEMYEGMQIRKREFYVSPKGEDQVIVIL